jgi:hypothetical protein
MSHHPRDMTLAELEALPTVSRLFKDEREFVAGNGEIAAEGHVEEGRPCAGQRILHHLKSSRTVQKAETQMMVQTAASAS